MPEDVVEKVIAEDAMRFLVYVGTPLGAIAGVIHMALSTPSGQFLVKQVYDILFQN